MAIRTKRLQNGLLLKPCSASSISSLDKLKNGNLINGLIFIDSSDQRLKIQIENQERQILTTSQSQVITNKTISTNDNTIQVSASGVVSTELDAALAEIRMLIDDTSGAEVEIFNSTITIGSTAPSVTGIMYHKATDDIAFKKANIQIFGKNEVYDGVLQMDCKVGSLPDESMQSIFSPTTTPTVKFVVAENDTVFNSAVSTYFPAISLISKVIEQTIGSEKKYIVIGSFSFKGDVTKQNIIRINSDGSEDTTFTENATRTLNSPNFNSAIYDILLEDSGTLLVAGDFSNFKASGVNCLIRLNADGSFNPNDPFNVNMVGKFTIDVGASIQENCRQVKSIDSNIFYKKFKYISLNNYSQNIIKCNNSGITDIIFVEISVPNSSSITDFALTSTHVYIGGTFLNYGGSSGLNNAARFNIGNGSIDGNFTAATTNKFNSSVNRIRVQSDGKILFSGSFTNYNTVTGLNRILRLNSDLTVDSEFKDNILNKVTAPSAINLQYDNKILLQGQYNSVNGVYRLNANGSEDKAFNFFAKTNFNLIYSVPFVFGDLMFWIQSDGILLGGQFLKKVINYPERYNEYMQATRTNEDGFVISTINDGQFVRLDISNIPTGYVGTIQVVLTGVKIL